MLMTSHTSYCILPLHPLTLLSSPLLIFFFFSLTGKLTDGIHYLFFLVCLFCFVLLLLLLCSLCHLDHNRLPGLVFVKLPQCSIGCLLL